MQSAAQRGCGAQRSAGVELEWSLVEGKVVNRARVTNDFGGGGVCFSLVFCLRESPPRGGGERKKVAFWLREGKTREKQTEIKTRRVSSFVLRGSFGIASDALR